MMWIKLLMEDYNYNFNLDPKSEYIRLNEMISISDIEMLASLKCHHDELWIYLYRKKDFIGIYTRWKIYKFINEFRDLFRMRMIVRDDRIIGMDHELIVMILRSDHILSYLIDQ